MVFTMCPLLEDSIPFRAIGEKCSSCKLTLSPNLEPEPCTETLQSQPKDPRPVPPNSWKHTASWISHSTSRALGLHTQIVQP